MLPKPTKGIEGSQGKEKKQNKRKKAILGGRRGKRWYPESEKVIQNL